MLTLHSNIYRRLLQPLLFKLSPETAQRVANFVLRRRAIWRVLSPLMEVTDDALALDFCGLKLENPVGLAAGYDKDCELLPSLAALGFGYLVGGTVTLLPRIGNPHPRIFRYVDQQSLINSMGFPSKGLEHAVRELAGISMSHNRVPIMISVSGLTTEDILICHRRLEPIVEAVELNISSPNTEGLRLFHEPQTLRNLLRRINENRHKPLLIKIPPYTCEAQVSDLPEKEWKERMALVRVCLEEGADAVTVANSRMTKDSRLSVGVGGLSGKALFEGTLRMVKDVRSEVGPRLSIAACGGIFSAEDAWSVIKAGATTVQIYTGLVYCGPGVANEINRGLLMLMQCEGLSSIKAVRDY